MAKRLVELDNETGYLKEVDPKRVKHAALAVHDYILDASVEESIMKSLTQYLVLAIMIGFASESALAIDISELSLEPTRACKKPPKSPPYKLMHKNYNAATSSNYPFNDTVDINGDGWCDWVSAAAAPPHRGDLDEPALEDFIFLGTKSGWRKFGDMKKFRIDTNRGSPTNWLTPYSGIYSFVNPTLVYSVKQPVPYVADMTLLNDIIDPNLTNVFIHEWDTNFDLLREVSKQDREMIIQFLRTKLCEPGKDYSGDISVQRAICGKQPEL